MARPAFLQKLKRGLWLNAKNFPFFVDTWNYLVERSNGLRGDKDVSPQNGYITVDNTDEEAPIVRFAPPNDFWKEKDGVKLSADSDIQSLQQKSIEKIKLEGQDEDEDYLQIYGFDDSTTVQGDETNHDFVVRNKSSNTIEYVPYHSGGGGGGEEATRGDADYGALGQKSIETKMVTVGGSQHRVAQLYDFDDGVAVEADPDQHEVVVRDTNTNSIGYVTLESITDAKPHSDGNFRITSITKSEEQGGDVSYEFTVDDGYYCIGRQYVAMSGITITTSGYLTLRVPMGSSTGNATWTRLNPTTQPTYQYSYIPQYYFDCEDGTYLDFRGAPVIQSWEN